MDSNGTEKKLALSYTLITILGTVASITCGISWGHWKLTLDQCIGRNCSCILYGIHTPTVFLGGNAGYCIWTTYGPFLYILLSIIMACFHGYRVLFMKTEMITRTVTAKNEVGETIELRAVQGEGPRLLPRLFWIIMSCISVFFTIYTVVHFSIYIDGYLSTCRQYRLTLQKYISLGGTIIPVIQGRLSCTAIFDFMDYIQPDTGNAYREGFINTGLDISLGVAASFFTFFIFLFVTMCNIKFVHTKL